MAKDNQTTRQDGIATLAYLDKWGPSATWCIADYLKIKTRIALQMMKILEAQGLVVKSERYGDRNNYCWELPKSKAGE